MTNSLSDKRLLLVGSYPPPFGGVSSFITELEKGLAEHVNQFYVLSFHSDTSMISKSPNTVIHKLPNRPNAYLFRSLATNPLKLLFLTYKYLSNVYKDPHLYTGSLLNALITAAVAKKNRSNSITVFTTRAGATIPFIKCLLPNVPIYYCVFADPYKNPDFYEKHRRWYREAMLKAKKVFSSSHYCAAVTKLFDTSIQAGVIYVGVDTKRFHPSTPQTESRRQLGLPEDRELILSVARMEPEMGVPDILAIAERVLSANNKACFVMAGAKGAVTPQVEEAAAKSGGRIICRVDVTANDLPKYYAASTIVMAPTVGVHACMGVSVKEAMAAGKPVVVSDSGGLPEAVKHEYNGLIIPLSATGGVDTEAFSRALLALLAEPPRREAMGEHSRVRGLELFAADTSVKNYMAMISNA